MGFIPDPVDLDLFYETLIDVLLEAVGRQQMNLALCFEKFQGFDVDKGVAFNEYEEMLAWALPTSFSKDEREKQFVRLLKAAGDEDADGDIDDAGHFAVAVMRTPGQPLRHPRDTRRFWALPWDGDI